MSKTSYGIMIGLQIDDAEVFSDAFDVDAVSKITSDLFKDKFLVPQGDIPSATIQSVLLQNAGRTFTANIIFDVSDADEIIKASRKAYFDCWQDEDWVPGSVEEALFEIYAASNANPSPDTMGFAFTSFSLLKVEEASAEAPDPV